MNLVPRILFHTYNRRGLGHLMRGLNIATELKKLSPQAEVLFYTRGNPPAGFAEVDVQFFIDTDEDRSSWREVAKSFDPNVVVFDTMLPASPEDLHAARNAAFVYVMRKSKSERQDEICRHWSIPLMHRIIVPHGQRDFAFDLPSDIAEKTQFVGTIVRRPDRLKSDMLASKYGLGGKESEHSVAEPAFKLLSTPGGGGFVDEATRFFDAVTAAHALLRERIPNFQHIVIKGPKYPLEVAAVDGMQVVESEPDLVHLFPNMDLVLSAGGYNPVNELRAAKTPTLLLPSPRTHDDQLERVEAMQAAGLARVCTSTSTDEIADAIVELCISPTELVRMRESYTNDIPMIGNESAASLILESCSNAQIS